MAKRTLLVLGLTLLIPMVAVPYSFASQPDLHTTTPQQNDDLTQTWYWPELGLSLMYPADWQSTLNQQNFNFVLFGPPFEDSEQVPYLTLQSSTYDPAQESLADIFDQIAGEDVEVTEITFADSTAWQFELVNDTQQTRFIGFGANDNDLALIGLAAPSNQWDTVEPLFDAIVGEAVISPIELDHDVLNAQMLTNFKENDVIGVGNPDAPVRVAEFMDFSCPHCANYVGSMERLMQDYVVSENVFVEFVVLDIIGGEASQVAAKIQVCGTQLGVGWDVHEVVFEVFFDEGRDGYTVENLIDAVTKADLGVSEEDFAACVAELDVSEFIADQLTLATEENVSSTPSLLFSTVENPDLDFIRTPEGEPLAGGLPLVFIYNHLDNLLEQVTASE